MIYRSRIAFVSVVLLAQCMAFAQQTQNSSKSSEGSLGPLTFSSFGDSQVFDKGQNALSDEYIQGNAVAHGLECPLCVNSPGFERARPDIPAFGSKGSWQFLRGRGELYTQIGGVNAWLPDYGQPHPGLRSGSWDDNWLLEGSFGALVSLDSRHRVSLGAEWLHVENVANSDQFGNNRARWNSLMFSLTWNFGR